MKKAQLFTIIIFLMLSRSTNLQGQSPHIHSCFPVISPCQDAKTNIYSYSFNICEYDPWVLVFEDDFSGSELDEYKWRKWGDGVPRDLNFNGTKYLTKLANVKVDNGFLKLIGKEEYLPNQAYNTWETPPPLPTDFYYSSGEVQSENKFFYGKFESRIRLAKGKGLWPSFWLFGNPWTEIDIFEFRNETNCFNQYDALLNQRVLKTDVHVTDSQGNVSSCNMNFTVLLNGNPIDLSDEFHVYSVTFEKGRIEWFIDGILVRSMPRFYNYLGGSVGCTIKAWTQYLEDKNYPNYPMEITLSMGIENGQNMPDGSTIFPNSMDIDWVKVYHRGQCGNKEIYSTEANPYPINPDRFNAIVGSNVTINGEFVVPYNHQMDLLASNSITLNAGFAVNPGAKFLAEINPNICSENKRSANEIELEKSSETNGNIVFPNPSEGVFRIAINNQNLPFNVEIFDLKGQLITSYPQNTTNEIELNLTHLPKGVYFIKCSDKNEKLFYTHQIVIL